MRLRDHLEKLRYFFEVAKAGSIKEGASILHLTQPSVTKSIKILEDAIGANLFIRQPRGVVVTKEGQLLLDYCHDLFAQLEDIEVRLQAPGDPMAGSIRVGTYDSIAIYFWPKFLQKFLKNFPSLDLELSTDRSHTIQKKVENGELDVGLIIEPRNTATVNTLKLATDAFHVYRSAKMKKEDVENPETPLIYMPDALSGEKHSRLNHLLNTKDSERKQFRTSSLESAKELILNGIGLGLLPRMVAQDAVQKKQLVQFVPKGFPKAGIGSHRIGLVYPKHKETSQVLQGLIAELKSQKWD